MKSIMVCALAIFLSALKNNVNAQDFEYGKITHNDINLKNTAGDSSANAFVIREYGESSMKLDDNSGQLYIDFLYHVKLKIVNKNGFSNGDISIHKYIYKDREDEVEALTATTFNYTNGNLQRHELDKKNVFTEKVNKYHELTKFTMPALAEGSIIEYRYHIKQPYIFNFRGWDFQSDIPKAYSEYVAYIPGVYNYNASLRGYKKLDSTSSKIAREHFYVLGKKYDCSRLAYIMRNIPAFKEEEYMTAASNFRSAIYYELSDYYNLNTGGKENVTRTWKDVDEELRTDKSFGGQLKQKSVFEEILPALLKDNPDPLAKAKAIYYYIGKTIRHNGVIGIYAESTIKKALESHSGNTADINLALVAALNAAGLDADPVILSTRDNGTVNSLYPVLSEFNYVAVKLTIGEQAYLLDATQELLPFGMLPLHCINGEGRVVNFKKPSYWYPLKAGQRESVTYSMTGELTEEGKIKGQLTIISTGYAALRKRKEILASSSVDDYVEALDEEMGKTAILKHDIANLDSLDRSLSETYEFEMKVFDDMAKDKLFYNPFFIDRISKNPFNLNERTYPVDLGSARESRITAMIRLPAGFHVAEKPKDLSIGLSENGGKYIFSAAEDEGLLTYNQLFQLSKPVYVSEDYLSLKELFSRIIQLQKTDIIINRTRK